MESDLVKINKLLLPLTWFYGAAVNLRNSLFDAGILKSTHFSTPVISIGNLTCGGTGKTPLVEYLIRLLSARARVAVLSRGYKRKSRGYLLASASTPMPLIGDEPWQMCQKFPNVHVAVDADRVHGITHLLSDEDTRDTEVILLDDAFQHRYVKPDLNILLIDYHRLITHDRLLPAGRLREPVHNKSRADMVIVTKCPHDITPMGYRVIQKSLDLHPFQDLFFAALRYGKLTSLFTSQERTLESLTSRESVLLITGIAVPEQMQQDLEHYTRHLTTLSFPDHHAFTPADVEKLNSRFLSLPAPRLAITTEKDASRLLHLEGLAPELRDALYVLPVEMEILRGKADTFNKKIINHVFRNQRNGRVAKSKNTD